MAGLNPDTTFTPALRLAFPNDRIIVVKNALGGQPIRRWYKAWQAPADTAVKANTTPLDDLYDRLRADVRKATGDQKPDTITFV